ncbi:MAG: uroporphyrinogen-III C-methyltransferase [Acidimicrobiales bacterium]
MTVYLVGAGPGDPGLMTVRGAEVMRRADVVVHDRLSQPSLLDLAPADAERVDVGKSPGSPIAQADINALLVERGRAGLAVVRLKGGDPFVFGRGGEEAAALIEAGVAFEVVPGVSSAVAVPAYAGIPVTHRGLSTSFTVVTGHSRHAVDSDTDWAALARAGDTIVVLMGVAHRAEIADRLVAGGLPPATPVAAVRWGTHPGQVTVRTTLAALASVDLEPPVTMVIGRVAGLDLSWFEARPLFGRRVVVTRARDQASGLVARLRDFGAEVLELPTIEIVDPSDGGVALRAAAAAVADHAWACFTSANAVERFFACLTDARALGGVGVAAVGPATTAALQGRGVVADLVPAQAVADALVEVFPTAPPMSAGDGRRVLLPQAAAARPILAAGLAAKGWEVNEVEAYRTRPVRPADDALAMAAKADAIAFTSSSTVTNYLAAAGPSCVPPLVASIGPVTAATAHRAGLTVSLVADPHTVDGLVAAIVGALAAVRSNA